MHQLGKNSFGILLGKIMEPHCLEIKKNAINMYILCVIFLMASIKHNEVQNDFGSIQ